MNEIKNFEYDLFLIRPAMTFKKGRVKFIVNGPLYIKQMISDDSMIDATKAINHFVIVEIRYYFSLYK